MPSRDAHTPSFSVGFDSRAPRRHPLVARLGIFFSEARGNPTEQGVRPHGAPIGHHSMHGSLTHAPWRLALAFVAPSMVHGRHGGRVLRVREGAQNLYFPPPPPRWIVRLLYRLRDDQKMKKSREIQRFFHWESQSKCPI